MVPGVGIEVNGAKRWIGAGFFQIQPSEIAKVALILYGAHLLATRPKMTGRSADDDALPRRRRRCLGLVVVEPDLGTAMVACFAVGGDADRGRRPDAPDLAMLAARSRGASSCSRS